MRRYVPQYAQQPRRGFRIGDYVKIKPYALITDDNAMIPGSDDPYMYYEDNHGKIVDFMCDSTMYNNGAALVEIVDYNGKKQQVFINTEKLE